MIQPDPMHGATESEAGNVQRAGGDEDAPQSMSLLGGIAGGEGPSAAEEFGFDESDLGAGNRGLSRGTVLVILIAVAALGALYAMRVIQGDVGGGGDAQIEARMEQILAKLANPDALDENDPLRPQNIESLFRDTDSIVASLDTDVSGRQVPAGFVKKNPFALPGAEEPEREIIDDGAERREARRRQLASELDRLSLQSIMGSGANSAAVINGEIYRQGDTIGSFRIDTISSSGQRVTLEAEDHSFTLSMGE